MIEPRIRYLTEINTQNGVPSWFYERDLAERYIKHQEERYKRTGEVIPCVAIRDLPEDVQERLNL